MAKLVLEIREGLFITFLGGLGSKACSGYLEECKMILALDNCLTVCPCRWPLVVALFT